MLLWGLAWERQSVGRWQRDLTPTAFPLAVLLEWGHTITFYSTALYDVTAWGVITFDVCGPPPPICPWKWGALLGAMWVRLGALVWLLACPPTSSWAGSDVVKRSSCGMSPHTVKSAPCQVVLWLPLL